MTVQVQLSLPSLHGNMVHQQTEGKAPISVVQSKHCILSGSVMRGGKRLLSVCRHKQHVQMETEKCRLSSVCFD